MYKVSILVSGNRTPGFCQFASELASAHQLYGLVKPEKDDLYTLEVQGTSVQINNFIEGCNKNQQGWTIVLYRLQSLESPVFNTFKVTEDAQTF